nr:MAG TPA: hypothetical protein [Caudoviricetes sp.]
MVLFFSSSLKNIYSLSLPLKPSVPRANGLPDCF